MANPAVILDAELRLRNQRGITRQIQSFQKQINRGNLLNLNTKGITEPLGQISKSAGEFEKSLAASNARVLAFGASVAIIAGVQRAFAALVTETVEVEKALADINVILNETTSGLGKFSNELFEIAKNTGQSFKVAAAAATELARQGLGAEETLRRVNDALILTRLSGIDATRAVEGLTAVVNGFARQAINTTEIINTLANVDAAFAVSTADLVDALARVGSTAQSAGVGFNELISIVTSAQQITARGGKVIGNSLKTIFTRLQRSSTLEALEDLGIATQNANGGFRDGISLLSDLANSYDTLQDSQKAYVSELVGGVFQINVLKALLGDLGREVSIYDGALSVANRTTDEAIRRNERLNQTISASVNEVKNNVSELLSTLGNIGADTPIRNILGIVNDIAEFFQDKLGEDSGSNLAKGFVKGFGAVLGGPALVSAAIIATKLILTTARFASQAVGSYLKVGGQAQKIKVLQDSINVALQEAGTSYHAILAGAKGVEQAERRVLAILLQQNALRQGDIGINVGASLHNKGLRFKKEEGIFKGSILRRRAEGSKELIPAIAREKRSVEQGVGGAGRGASPVVVPNFNFGKGKTGTVVANTDELMVPNFGGTGADAIFNKNMVHKFGVPDGAERLAAKGLIPNFAKGPREIRKGEVLRKDFIKWFHAKGKKRKDGTRKELKRGQRIFGLEYDTIDGEPRSGTYKRGFAVKSLPRQGAKTSFYRKGIKKNKKTVPLVNMKRLKAAHKNPEFGGDLEQIIGKGAYESARLTLLKNFTTGGRTYKIVDYAKGLIPNFPIFGKSFKDRNKKPLLKGQVPPFSPPEVSFGRDFHDKQSGIGFNSERIGFGGFADVYGGRGRLKGSVEKKFIDLNKLNKTSTISQEFLMSKMAERNKLPISKVYGTHKRAQEKGRIVKERINGPTGRSVKNYINQQGIDGDDILYNVANRLEAKFKAKGIDPIDLRGRHIVGSENFIIKGRQADIESFINRNKGVGGRENIIDYLSDRAVAVDAGLFETFNKRFGSFAKGFIPNFPNPALDEAVDREIKATGLPKSQIRVESDASLASRFNPLGLGITNARDEPRGIGQGIRRAKKAGLDPKTHGTLFPSFAKGDATIPGLGNVADEIKDYLADKIGISKSGGEENRLQRGLSFAPSKSLKKNKKVLSNIVQKIAGKGIDEAKKIIEESGKDLSKVKVRKRKAFNVRDVVGDEETGEKALKSLRRRASVGGKTFKKDSQLVKDIDELKGSSVQKLNTILKRSEEPEKGYGTPTYKIRRQITSAAGADQYLQKVPAKGLPQIKTPIGKTFLEKSLGKDIGKVLDTSLEGLGKNIGSQFPNFKGDITKQDRKTQVENVRKFLIKKPKALVKDPKFYETISKIGSATDLTTDYQVRVQDKLFKNGGNLSKAMEEAGKDLSQMNKIKPGLLANTIVSSSNALSQFEFDLKQSKDGLKKSFQEQKDSRKEADLLLKSERTPLDKTERDYLIKRKRNQFFTQQGLDPRMYSTLGKDLKTQVDKSVNDAAAEQVLSRTSVKGQAQVFKDYGIKDTGVRQKKPGAFAKARKFIGGDRFSQAAFMGSFALSGIGGAVGKGSLGGGLQGAGVGASFGLFGGGPGIIAGAAIGGIFGVLKSEVNKLAPSLEELDKKFQKITATFQKNSEAAQQFIKTQSSLKEAIESGASESHIRTVRAQLVEQFGSITDSELRKGLLSARGNVDLQFEAFEKNRRIGEQEISRAGLASLFSSIGQENSAIGFNRIGLNKTFKTLADATQFLSGAPASQDYTRVKGTTTTEQIERLAREVVTTGRLGASGAGGDERANIIQGKLQTALDTAGTDGGMVNLIRVLDSLGLSGDKVAYLFNNLGERMLFLRKTLDFSKEAQQAQLFAKEQSKVVEGMGKFVKELQTLDRLLAIENEVANLEKKYQENLNIQKRRNILSLAGSRLSPRTVSRESGKIDFSALINSQRQERSANLLKQTAALRKILIDTDKFTQAAIRDLTIDLQEIERSGGNIEPLLEKIIKDDSTGVFKQGGKETRRVLEAQLYEAQGSNAKLDIVQEYQKQMALEQIKTTNAVNAQKALETAIGGKDPLDVGRDILSGEFSLQDIVEPFKDAAKLGFIRRQASRDVNTFGGERNRRRETNAIVEEAVVKSEAFGIFKSLGLDIPKGVQEIMNEGRRIVIKNVAKLGVESQIQGLSEKGSFRLGGYQKSETIRAIKSGDPEKVQKAIEFYQQEARVPVSAEVQDTALEMVGILESFKEVLNAIENQNFEDPIVEAIGKLASDLRGGSATLETITKAISNISIPSESAEPDGSSKTRTNFGNKIKQLGEGRDFSVRRVAIKSLEDERQEKISRKETLQNDLDLSSSRRGINPKALGGKEKAERLRKEADLLEEESIGIAKRVRHLPEDDKVRLRGVETMDFLRDRIVRKRASATEAEKNAKITETSFGNVGLFDPILKAVRSGRFTEEDTLGTIAEVVRKDPDFSEIRDTAVRAGGSNSVEDLSNYLAENLGQITRFIGEEDLSTNETNIQEIQTLSEAIIKLDGTIENNTKALTKDEFESGKAALDRVSASISPFTGYRKQTVEELYNDNVRDGPFSTELPKAFVSGPGVNSLDPVLVKQMNESMNLLVVGLDKYSRSTQEQVLGKVESVLNLKGMIQGDNNISQEEIDFWNEAIPKLQEEVNEIKRNSFNNIKKPPSKSISVDIPRSRHTPTY